MYENSLVIVMCSDVVSLAFAWDCDEFLQRVFLELDPYSLKTSRKVNTNLVNEVIVKILLAGMFSLE